MLNRIAFLLLIGLFCANAQAQVNTTRFNNLRVIENPSHAGDALIARILYGDCPPDEQPGVPQVALQGTVVTMTITMMATPGLICVGTPPPPSDVDFALGRFNPGTYTLIVQPVSALPGVTYAPLTTTFTVGAARAIPVLSPGFMAMLMLALMLCAWQVPQLRKRISMR